jgi:nitroreductase
MAAMPRRPSPQDVVRPLLRVRQIREHTSQPVDEAAVAAIADAGRWSGSSQNQQPWRFIVIRSEVTIRQIAVLGQPQTRSLHTAMAAVAVVMPAEPERAVADAFDEGRAAERMLIAASLLGLGGAIAWITRDARAPVAALLGLPKDRMVRTIVALGHPTEAARRPKSAPGAARRPRDEAVFEERWPAG